MMCDHREILEKRDAVYAETPRQLRWNVFHPADASGKKPAVLLYHGGGWRAGDRANMTAACTAFAELGYVAIAPEYRLLGEASWPAPLLDARTAVRAVRAQAEILGIDPNFIFLTGYSAGAHLALMVASGIAGPAAEDEPCREQSESIAGVAAFFPPTRIEAQQSAAMGIHDSKMLAAMNLAMHIDRYPPVILFCGDEDTMTPPALSLELYLAIRRAGGAADLRLYSNLIHEFVSLPGMMTATVRDAAAFFARTVLNKPAFDAALADLHKWWDERSQK